MSPDTIFVIEDTEDDLFFLKRAARQAGLTNPIEIATDGEAGFNILLKLVEDSRVTGRLVMPLVLLLDLQLPKMNGFEVLEGIRRTPELAKLVVVVLTSSDADSDVLLAYELGARSYLVKPPDPRDLTAIVRSVHEHASRGWLAPIDLPGLKKRKET